MNLVKMDEIYRNVPLEEIPWNIETAPDALVELVESGRVKPCKTIDLGCGTGNYAIYLASMGFDVTGMFPICRDSLLSVVEFDCVLINKSLA